LVITRLWLRKMGEIKTIKASILNSSDIEVRGYQVKIAEECSNKNSLVVLPTGLGKTIIAVLVASKILENVPSESKIIVLAPTRPLINQHYETFLKFLNIPKDKFSRRVFRPKSRWYFIGTNSFTWRF